MRQAIIEVNLSVVQYLLLMMGLGAFPKTFPLQLVWLSSVILFLGGGLNSASAFMWAMASESIPQERRYNGSCFKPRDTTG